MDITTFWCYMIILPIAILGLSVVCGVLWMLREFVKCTVDVYKDRCYIGMVVVFTWWVGLIGVVLVVIGELMN